MSGKTRFLRWPRTPAYPAGRIASGPNAGQRPGVLGQFNEEASAEDEQFQIDAPYCAKVSGFSVHAGVGIRSTDRKGLERNSMLGSRCFSRPSKC